MIDNYSADKKPQQGSAQSPTDVNETMPTPTPRKKPKKENMLVNILMNIVVPTLILMKLSGDQYLGATWALIIALSFPIGYGLTDYIKHRKFNFFSALGVVSVLLTGGISLLHLPTQYYAIKEAAIPGIIGLSVIISIRTRFPLVRTFLYNDTILKIEKISHALAERGNTEKFEKTLRYGSYFIATSFFVSSILNYILAKMIVVSESGTEAFNIEIGKMHALSFPIIAVPSMIIMMATLFYIFRSIRLLTDLSFEEVMNDGSEN